MVKLKGRSEESTQLARERRKQILKASMRCFRKRGFHQTTLRDIAAEFGMSVGHIYNYFESKEAIIEALVENNVTRFNEMVSQEKLHRPSTAKRVPREYLATFVDAYLDPEIAPFAVAIMNEAMINPRIYDITVSATARIREHIIKTYYSGFDDDEDYLSRVPAALTEARIVSFRSMLEGLRFSILFNPHTDRELLKQVTIDRLLMLIEKEREEDLRRFGKSSQNS